MISLGLFQANKDARFSCGVLFVPSAAFSGWKGFCKTKRERGWVGDVDVVEWIGWITMDGWNWITVVKMEPLNLPWWNGIERI